MNTYEEFNNETEIKNYLVIRRLGEFKINQTSQTAQDLINDAEVFN